MLVISVILDIEFWILLLVGWILCGDVVVIILFGFINILGLFLCGLIEWIILGYVF